MLRQAVGKSSKMAKRDGRWIVVGEVSRSGGKGRGEEMRREARRR